MVQYKGYVIAAVLALIWFLESAFPHFEKYVRNRRARLVHDGRNLAIGIINGVSMALLVAGLTKMVADWSAAKNFGLLYRIRLPSFWPTLLAIVLFDFWMYAWHWLNHNLAFLWRFHRMHHSDPALDATSALRFHPGEVLMSGILRLPVIAGIGLTLWQLALYELILFPIIILHHSNVEFPHRLDKALRWLIVTPSVHWVHHSHLAHETNSNYGSIFSFWDRLFRTLRLRFFHELKEITYGLDEFNKPNHHSLAGLLKTPFSKS